MILEMLSVHMLLQQPLYTVKGSRTPFIWRQAVTPKQTRQDAADATLEKTKYKEHRN